ncbi:MAG: hypothetical protein M3Q05_11010, partial [Bacteroidota bacterium]|nr:hypothetical protein [Bacteroidota bacterium]
GVVMQIITHGLSTGALFILAGFLYQRLHTRDIQQMGGFWSNIPKMGVITMVFVMASLGLPGLGNFIAEFLTLVGSWQANRTLTILATIGLVAATAYSLRIMQKVFLGKNYSEHLLPDLNFREMIMAISLVIVILWLGLNPQPVLERARFTLEEQLQAYPIPKVKTAKPIQVAQQNIAPDTTKVLSTQAKGGSNGLK